jgi:hypothetical protein
MMASLTFRAAEARRVLAAAAQAKAGIGALNKEVRHCHCHYQSEVREKLHANLRLGGFSDLFQHACHHLQHASSSHDTTFDEDQLMALALAAEFEQLRQTEEADADLAADMAAGMGTLPGHLPGEVWSWVLLLLPCSVCQPALY